MATTYTDNGGGVANGSKLEFTYTFPVLQTEDVKVALNGVTLETTKYAVDTASNPTKITFNSTTESSVQTSTGAPKTGVRVRVYRETTVGKTSGDDDPKAVFASGSSIRAIDLNANTEQALYAIHELQSRPIENEDIQDGSITTNKLENNIITNANVADNAIDSRNYVDGSIDTEHIADNQVTAAKLADSINSAIAANTAKNTNVTTNLSTNTTETAVTIVSSDGTNAVIAEANDTNAGVMSVTDHNKLAGIENNAKDDQTAEEIKTLLNGSGLVNAQIASDANIDGSKINPSFGDQNIIGNGNLQVGQGQFSTPTNNQIILIDDESGNDTAAARVAMAFRNQNGTQLGKIGPFYNDTDIYIQNDVNDGHFVVRTKTGDNSTKRFTVNTSGAEVDGDLTVTNGTIAGTLNSSVTATTQAATDSSTKIATTAFAKGVFSDQQTAIDAKLPLAGGTITGNLKLQSNFPRLLIVDGNNTNTFLPDYVLQLNEGVLKISEKDNVNDAPSTDRIYIRREATGTNDNGDPVYGRSVELVDEVVLKRANPKIQFKDTSGSPNDDYRIKVNSGNFEIEDFKNNATDPRLRIFDNGDVKIWHNLTLLDGKTVDGRDISADGAQLDNLVTSTLSLTGGTIDGNVIFNDLKRLLFGSDSDFKIVHTGSLADIVNTTGNLRLATGTGDNILFRTQNNDNTHTNLIICDGTTGSEHVDLYHSGNRRLATESDGVRVVGTLKAGFEGSLPSINSVTRAVFSGSFDNTDSSQNSSSAISILCKGGSNSRINLGNDTKEDQSQIRYRNGSNDIQFLVTDPSNNQHNSLLEIDYDSVKLNYLGAKKAETSATGFDITGDLTATGNINSNGTLTLTSNIPDILFAENNVTPDYRIKANNGELKIIGEFTSASGTSLDDKVTIEPHQITVHKNFTVSGELTASGNIDLTDSSNILLGTDDDLEISHDGSIGKIKNNTGNFNIYCCDGNAVSLRNNAGNEFLLNATEGAAISLYYDGALASQTTSTGFNVVGTTFKLRNTANNADLVKIFHSGATDGNTVISGQVGDVKIQPNEDGGQVKLFETTSGTTTQRLVTTSSGVTINGNLISGNINAESDGNTYITLRDTGHGFGASEIKLTNGGRDLNIIAPVDIRLFPLGGENGIVIEGNGSVEAYHDNVKKLSTTSSGVTVTGSVTTSTGILFGSDTADANTLDDYEEGTWTPTVLSEGNIGTPQYTCTYTKIGRLVTINADIHQLSDTTSSTNIKIGGLPYVPTTTSGNWSAACHGERYKGGNSNGIVAYLLYNSGAWGISFRFGVPSSHYAEVKHSDISDDGTDNNIRFTLTYELA